MARPNQAEYYQQTKLTPTRRDLEDAPTFRQDVRIRENLYQRLLHIPLGLLTGQDVLEIGCSTGESALLLALRGARLTLVDADPTIEARCRELFGRFGVSDQIRRLVITPFEEFDDVPAFALVTAEGFLFTLPNRAALLEKMGRLLRPGGVGVVSFPDRFGSFLEFVKKATLWRAYQLAGIADPQSDQALSLAERLLEPAYRRLPSARPFRTWWLDCMVSPFLTWDDCWDHEEILQAARRAGCIHYASTPRVFEPDPLAWYKQVPSEEDGFNQLRQALQVRRFDFLAGQRLRLPLGAPGLSEATAAVTAIQQALSGYFHDLNRSAPILDFAPVQEFLEAAGVRLPLLGELTSFFRSLAVPPEQMSLERFCEQYRSLDLLSGSWGRSYHYLAFVREGS